MKQLIAPAMIVALLAFIVIIDHKDFSRHDDVQTVQSEKPTTNRKPTGSVPETKSVTELKPAIETKPVVETKPAKVKPVETKSVAETKHVTESKTVTETTKPVAVPVVTAEGAETINEDAKAYAMAEKERKDPFYRFYQDTKLETICFQGSIRAISAIPDPEKNDYDDCLYALFVEIDSLFSEVKTNTQLACEVIVNAPIMKDKVILQDNRFLPGDKIRCTCAEYGAMPQDIQEIQLSDDIQDYEHQQYYPLEIKKISSFSLEGNRNFAKRVITILPIQSLPKDEKASALRKARIQNEISRIEQELKEHGGSFEKWKEEYKPIKEKYRQLCNEAWSGWIGDSFFATGGSESGYKTQEYIDGILPYKNYLDQNNIDLIVVRIPSKWDFAARVLASEDFQENPAWVEHYYECLKNDIEIIDPMPEMWKHRFDFPLFYFYHIPTEAHPFEGTSFIAAEVLSEVLKRYSFPLSEETISLENASINDDTRYYFPDGNDKIKTQDDLIFKKVLRDHKTIGNLVVNSGSPFIFLSNSFLWYPKRSLGASVPGYTAFFLQHIPDWLYQDGTGNPMIRNIIASPNALQKRHAVIMGAHPSYWRGDFPKIPRYILDNAQHIYFEKNINFFDFGNKMVDNGSFLFSINEKLEVQFFRNPEKENAALAFEINTGIPFQKKMSTCMLRINFIKNHNITIDVVNKTDKSLIDTQTIAPGTDNKADLFIPLSGETQEVTIVFSIPRKTSQKYIIKNIELWYY